MALHLQGLDLNLLIALDALLVERNVTRAAERMNISQPGMSAALQKLRWHFKDELLERIGRRLELTPRARELVDPVRDVLDRIRELAAPEQGFDPASAERLFRLGGSSFCSELLAIPLAQRLMSEAPGISFQFDDLLADTLPRLFEGSLDCTITLAQRLTLDPACVDKSLSEKPLFADRMVIALARGSQLVGESVTYEQFCELPYVETRFGGNFNSMSEQILRRHARRPRVHYWLPSFQQSLGLVSQSNMVTIAPSMLVRRYADVLGLRFIETPVEIPLLEERLFWHPRNDLDPGHRWFRNLLAEIAAEAVASLPASSGATELASGEIQEPRRLPA